VASSADTSAGARRRALAFLSLAELLILSLWFSASAVLPALSREWALGAGGRAGLTIAVQLGFILGTLASALTNLPDVWSPRALLIGSALVGAGANAVLALAVERLEPALLLRFVTGIAMAGAYPPAMKIMATWFREGRGLAIGTLVGALTVGSAAPHLIRGVTDRGPSDSPRPVSTWPWPPRCSASAARASPASATSDTCGSSTRCGPGSASSWPRASPLEAAAPTRE
jgi:MFS family permease